MRSPVKRLLQKILLNDISWRLLSPLVWIAERLSASRKNYLEYPNQKRLEAVAKNIFKDHVVCSGPFSGMIYNTGNNTGGSSYYAKLLGSYETEIHPFINNALTKQYDVIVNIGCDDGYYAVGMALKTACNVVAYDINPKAIEQTKQLAQVNNVQQRLEYGSRFTAEDIIYKYAGKRVLYISDCEGDELDVFNANIAPLLKRSDIIAELHLHIHPELEQHFRKYFSSTHDIRIVNSIPDFIKATTYTHPQLSGLDFETKHFITEEREVFMQWIYLEAKNNPIGPGQ